MNTLFDQKFRKLVQKSVEVPVRLRWLSIRPNIPDIPGGLANGKEIFRNFIFEYEVER